MTYRHCILEAHGSASAIFLREWFVIPSPGTAEPSFHFRRHAFTAPLRSYVARVAQLFVEILYDYSNIYAVFGRNIPLDGVQRTREVLIYPQNPQFYYDERASVHIGLVKVSLQNPSTVTDIKTKLPGRFSPLSSVRVASSHDHIQDRAWMIGQWP